MFDSLFVVLDSLLKVPFDFIDVGEVIAGIAIARIQLDSLFKSL